MPFRELRRRRSCNRSICKKTLFLPRQVFIYGVSVPEEKQARGGKTETESSIYYG